MIRPLVPSLDPSDLYDLGAEDVAGAVTNLVADWTQMELSRVYSGTAEIAGDEANNSVATDYEFSEIWTPSRKIIRATFSDVPLANNEYVLTTAPGYPMSPRFNIGNSNFAFGSFGNEGGSASWTVVGMLGGAAKNDAWSLANLSGRFVTEAPAIRPGGTEVHASYEVWQWIDEDGVLEESSAHWSLDAGDGSGGRVAVEGFAGVAAAVPFPLIDWALLLRGGTFETVTAVNETVGGWDHVGTLTWKMVLS